MSLREDKPLAWLTNEVKTPPFSREARIYAGGLLRRLQKGEKIVMPESRPMPSIGPGCHELRIEDVELNKIWRIIYKITKDAIVIGEVLNKKTKQTPQNTIDVCKKRFRLYELAAGDDHE